MRNVDYSFLFNNGTSTQNNSLYSSLSDLYSIKTGTYKKLVSAYYKKTGGDEADDKTSSKPWKDTVASSQSTELSKTADRIKSASGNLKNAADAFSASGDKSLFNQVDITTKAEDGTETTTKGYDMNAIYSAAKKFVDSYNGFVTEAGSSSSEAIKRQGSNMVTSTAVNAKLLSKVGISIGSDNKLSIDESTFKKADVSTIKTLFNGKNSFADNAATKASMISSTATSEAEVQKLYGSNAKTTNSIPNGNMWNSFF